MDESRLPPRSPEWLAYWDRQVYNHAIGLETALFPLEAMRAVMRYADNPASMFGRLCRASEAAGAGPVAR